MSHRRVAVLLSVLGAIGFLGLEALAAGPAPGGAAPHPIASLGF